MQIIRPGRPEDESSVVGLIVDQQSDPARACCYLGTQRDGILAELADLDVDWHATLQVTEVDGRITGASFADYDLEKGRSWIHGPWVDGDWVAEAPALIDAVIAALPAGITDHEISADLAHRAMAEVAGARGWKASEPNHVFVVKTAAAEAWPADDPRVREAAGGDQVAIAPLHEQEFPRTYYSAEELVAGQASGKFIVRVAEEGGFAGYASGRVQADGEGYLDFVAVPDDLRGRGLGEALVVASCRAILAASPQGTVNLTVQDHRANARRLYERLGFALDVSIVGYRST